jgi:hypothetical protein
MSAHRLLLAAFTTLVALSTPIAAQAPQSWTQVGSLLCKVDPNVGFIFVGHQNNGKIVTVIAGTPIEVTASAAGARGTYQSA